MDIQPSDQKTQALSDDQELAKVLAGVNNDDTDDEQTTSLPDPVVPPTPMPDAPQVAEDGTMPDPLAGDSNSSDTAVAEPELAMPPMPEVPEAPEAPAAPPTDSSASTGDLESIKQEALGELRPLVDKLNVSPEEKFDTYLLLLRSTDDRELIAPAHDAAKAITDEARKAQALLDIIKEIDFLSGNGQQPQSQ